MSDVTLHPNRYPTHPDQTKGQVYGGACNTTRCDNTGAVFWNGMTYGLYCRRCAEGINYRETICTKVEDKPSLEEMDKLYRAACKEFTS